MNLLCLIARHQYRLQLRQKSVEIPYMGTRIMSLDIETCRRCGKERDAR